MLIYVKSSATERSSLTKEVAVLNTSVAPILNSFIYNLRNQQLKQACKDLAHKVVFFRSKWK
jgi:olfactory receptor